MNKQELVRRLEAKNLPRYQYIILSGGSLVMHGLRAETHDIDICVSEVLAEELGIPNRKPNEHGYYELPGGIDVMVGMSKIDCEIINDYLCQTLDDILKFKKARNLPKDQKDIDMIEEYFAQQGHS